VTRAAIGPKSLRRVLAAALLLILAPPPTATFAARNDALIRAVGPVGLTVSDMDRSIEFYTKVLTFEKVSDREAAGPEIETLEGVFGARVRVVRLLLGAEQIELTEYLAPRGRPAPADARSNDRWFQHVAIIVSDMDKAYARLRQFHVEHASTGPQTLPAWNPKAGGIRAFYFKDPDEHTLEILSFPQDKGNARWHQTTGRLFLGIDHTAIVVSDTDTSLRFYRDVLGLEVGGESENYGVEQEHLNNVFGAHLRITSLHAASGPSIEFLEYLAPRDGRPFPADEKSNDLVHWQTTLVAANLDQAEQAFRIARAPHVSPGVVSLASTWPGPERGVLVRDPDGHVMEVVTDEPSSSRTP
jgi:catechol 2,3-dioxygenase-like lactoylglutathione lyase family enzyme